MRLEPAVSDRSRPFWAGGADGELRVLRCQACGWWLHPPRPICDRCHERDLAFEATSGQGTVWSFTISRVAWGGDGLEPPYVVAEVELDEQRGLRLLSSVVGCDDVTIGMPVHVRFEQVGDAWVPMFAP